MKQLLFVLGICSMATLAFAQNTKQDTTKQKKEDGARYNQYGVQVSRHPLMAEARNGILVLESKDNNYMFWLDNRIEFDGYYFSNKTMNPLGNGVALRRARFAVKANLPQNFYGEIDMDIAEGNFKMEDAYIGYMGVKDLTLKAGNFKEGFSMEETTTSRYVPFMERPMVVEAFAPGRTLGIQAAYQYKWLLGIGGVSFRAAQDAATSTIATDLNKAQGINEGYAVTGRLVATPICDLQKGLHFGVAASYRTPVTSGADGYATDRFNSRSESVVNRKKFVDTKKVLTNVNNDVLLGGEFAGYYKGFRFQSEYIQNTTNRNVAKTDAAQNSKYTLGGFYAMAGIVLFGGHQQYDRSAGEFTQPSRGKKWGDIELMGRYDYINLNNKDVYGGSASGTTIGLNYYATNNVKFVLDYAYLNHDRYANGGGSYLVGHDASGNLTSDYKKIVDAPNKAGEKYGQVGLRMEIDF